MHSVNAAPDLTVEEVNAANDEPTNRDFYFRNGEVLV